jgi:hypothetical protein
MNPHLIYMSLGFSRTWNILSITTVNGNGKCPSLANLTEPTNQSITAVYTTDVKKNDPINLFMNVCGN